MLRRPWPLALLLTLAAAPSQAQTVTYNRDIRPIFSENCYACHGPDSGKRKADLRLDTEAGAFGDAAKGGKKIIAPKKPEASELYLRISATGKGHMPPLKSEKSLTKTQIDLIKRWIEQGARWEKHWAFIAPKRPTLPAVKNAKWGRNPIDRFILSRLESSSITPSAEADRRTLLRRLSFDLTGLPPTPKEMDDFLSDKSTDAYGKAVNKLLASSHFGERMGMYWLDLVRFADTGGYHSDNHRDITLYRDWVINAFNKNKKFNTFTIEQLAGDLLPKPTRDQLIASGYNRLLMTTEEGGAQPKEYAAKYAADRVRNASSVWLGLTMGCAECHNHKFDPVSTKEFYQFASFWADIQERAVGRQAQTKMPSPEQLRRQKEIDGEVLTLRTSLDKSTPALEASQRLWEKTTLAKLDSTTSDWTTLKPEKAVSSGGATLTVQADNSILASGKNPAKDSYTVTLKTDLKNITALRLHALKHSTLANGGLSRGNGNFILTRVLVTLPAAKGKGKNVKIVRALADFSQPGYPVDSLVTGKRGGGWAVEGHVRKFDRVALFVFDKPIPGGPGTVLEIKLEHNSTFAQHTIGRFRLDLTAVAKPNLGDKGSLPPAIVAILKTVADKRTDAQKKALSAYYRTISPELDATRRKIAALLVEKQNLEKFTPQTLISMAGNPRVMRVLPRGNWLDESGEVVAPGVPASLSKLTFTGKRATRLDLANWMFSADHPLTARVFVNRLWKLLHGQGLVTSLEDFGAQGTWPSHPELLDWLAVEFRESGWDVKHMVKLMVTSATYRQSSKIRSDLSTKDPYNQLLARQGRFRLDAEMVRDNALAISDLLVRKIGGASVKPYQPAGYWQYLNFPTRRYVADKGEEQYRRGLYTYWQRTFPHPSLIAFDAPSREECTVERPRSNTPQQALVLLNDPTYVEAARVLAQNALKKGGKTDQDRLTYAYRQALQRSPSPAEASILLKLLTTHKKQYDADKQAVKDLLTVGQAATDETLDKTQLAAWMSVTRVLLNLHETITRE